MKLNLFLLLLFLGTIRLDAQVDTICRLGQLEKNYTPVEIESLIKKRQERMNTSAINYIVGFKVSHEEFKNDTLFRFGMINVMNQEIVSEEGKINGRLNKKVPEFEFEDLAGAMVKSADLEGKVVLINFWFTRCAPCIAEMPYLNQIQKDFVGKEVVFLSMAPEKKEEVFPFLNKHEFLFRHLPDADVFLKKFGVGFPKNILLDRTGQIKYIGHGLVGEPNGESEEVAESFHQKASNALKEQIQKLLQE